MPNHKPNTVMWDKFNHKGHTYTIVLIPSKRVALLLWDASQIPSDIYNCGLRGQFKQQRSRGLTDAIEADLILKLIDENGLILPDETFRITQLPYQALYEGGLRA